MQNRQDNGSVASILAEPPIRPVSPPTQASDDSPASSIPTMAHELPISAAGYPLADQCAPRPPSATSSTPTTATSVSSRSAPNPASHPADPVPATQPRHSRLSSISALPSRMLAVFSSTSNPPPTPQPAASAPPSTTHSHATTSLSLSASTSTTTHPSPPSSPTSIDTATTLPAARAALEATILSTGGAYTAALTTRARDLHANNAALGAQQAALLRATGALAGETDKLAKLAGEGARRLKEVGALDAWAEVLEGDLAAVEEVLRMVEGEGGEERCEACGGGLGEVEEDGVWWCAGCDGLWHVGCCGDGEGDRELDGGEETWRCRECALRDDLEAMVDELGGFVDDEMDTSGEIVVEPPRKAGLDQGELEVKVGVVGEGKGKGRARGAEDVDGGVKGTEERRGGEPEQLVGRGGGMDVEEFFEMGVNDGKDTDGIRDAQLDSATREVELGRLGSEQAAPVS